MNYPGHIGGGVIAFSIIIALAIPARFGQPCSAVGMGMWLGITLFGALFPDIDVHSTGRKVWHRLLFCGALLMTYHRQYQLLAPLLLLTAAPYMLKHRGITHRWWFITSMPLAGAWYLGHAYPLWHNEIYLSSIFFTAGALSHLALDYGPRWLPMPKNIARLLSKLFS